jgi:hypothetical protein
MRAWVAAALALATCVLGACGGGSDSRTEDDKRVESAVKRALTTKDDPKVCTRVMTQNFVEQLTLEMGELAVDDCEAGLRDGAANSVSMTRVRVHGPRASADVVLSGGDLPFSAMRIGLRRAFGQWRLDRVKTATVNRSQIVDEMRSSDSSGLDRRTSACAARALQRTSDKVLARSFLKRDLAVLLVPVIVCGVRIELAHLPAFVRTCAVRRARRALLHGRIGRQLRGAYLSEMESTMSDPRNRRVLRRIGASCARALRPAARPPILDSR